MTKITDFFKSTRQHPGIYLKLQNVLYVKNTPMYKFITKGEFFHKIKAWLKLKIRIFQIS